MMPVEYEMRVLLYCCGRWCQQDMMPVYHSHNTGSYTADVTDAEYALVFASYKPTSKL